MGAVRKIEKAMGDGEKKFLKKKFLLRNTFVGILHGNMISKVDQFALLGFV